APGVDHARLARGLPGLAAVPRDPEGLEGDVLLRVDADHELADRDEAALILGLVLGRREDYESEDGHHTDIPRWRPQASGSRPQPEVQAPGGGPALLRLSTNGGLSCRVE